MSAKEFLFSEAARLALLHGADVLADAAKITLGTRGRNVVSERPSRPSLTTKEGVTAAKQVEVCDKFENLGAQMLKELASTTNDDAGDGTMTATILARIILREGIKTVGLGHNPVDTKRGIDNAGVNVLKCALMEPVPAIAANAGHESSVVAERVLASNEIAFGFNTVTEKYEDPFDAGVIDLYKVVRCALENAASVASLLLMTETVII